MRRSGFRGTPARVATLIHGHVWTVAPVVSAAWRPVPVPPHRPWHTLLEDPRIGHVRLSGALHVPAAGSDTVLVALHGLGGDIDSHYIRRCARAASLAGVACLRLNMRGADLSGEDLYHAGLTDDLHAALASEALAGFRHIVAIGYSIGGHLMLRMASESHDPRLRAVAAICPPLDLARAARDIDRKRRFAYRQHVLGALKQMLRAIHQRRPLPMGLDRALAIRHCRHYDQEIVAPRFGFGDADAYYRQMSVAGRMSDVAVPALVVAARGDPMVLPSSIAPGLSSGRLETIWLDRGGHVGFPPDTSLGLSAPLGLEPQALAWLLARVT